MDVVSHLVFVGQLLTSLSLSSRSILLCPSLVPPSKIEEDWDRWLKWTEKLTMGLVGVWEIEHLLYLLPRLKVIGIDWLKWIGQLPMGLGNCQWDWVRFEKSSSSCTAIVAHLLLFIVIDCYISAAVVICSSNFCQDALHPSRKEGPLQKEKGWERTTERERLPEDSGPCSVSFKAEEAHLPVKTWF